MELVFQILSICYYKISNFLLTRSLLQFLSIATQFTCIIKAHNVHSKPEKFILKIITYQVNKFEGTDCYKKLIHNGKKN